MPRRPAAPHRRSRDRPRGARCRRSPRDPRARTTADRRSRGLREPGGADRRTPGNRPASIASATSASARPVTPPPHGFSRGCDASTIVTRAPRVASTYAARAPAGPAPTITTSSRINSALRDCRLQSADFRLIANRSALLQSAFCNLPVIHYSPMIEVPVGLFTVGVFQDVAWAAKGIDALKQAGFPPESLTILAKDTPEAAALIEKALGAKGDRLDVAGGRRRRRSRPAARTRSRAPPATSPSWGCPARCAASGFRRTTGESSRRSPAAAGSSSRSAASRARPMRSRFSTPTAAAMRRSAPGSAESSVRIADCGLRIRIGRRPTSDQSAIRIRNPQSRTARPRLAVDRLTNTHGSRGTSFAVAPTETSARQYLNEPHSLSDGRTQPDSRSPRERIRRASVCPRGGRAPGRHPVHVRTAPEANRPGLCGIADFARGCSGFLVIFAVRYSSQHGDLGGGAARSAESEHHLAEPAGPWRRRWRRRQPDEGTAARGRAARQGQNYRSRQQATEARDGGGQEGT